MITPSNLPVLRGQLPEDAWLETILAWRQDPIIWASVTSEELLAHIADDARQWPRDYTPAYLGLALLGRQSQLQRLLFDPIQPCESELEEAINSLLPEPSDTEAQALPDIKSALASAIDLRRLLLENDNEEELSARLTASGTVLACLLGMIPNPAQLISTLISRIDSQPSMDCLLQAYLTNPIDSHERLGFLNSLLEGLTVHQVQYALNSLNRRRPDLAKSLYLSQFASTPDPQIDPDLPGCCYAQLLDRLEQSVGSSERLYLTNHPEQAIQHLTRALNTSKYIQAQLYARLARISASGQASIESRSPYPSIAVEAWKRANQLARDVPEYAAGYTQALVISGNQEKARSFLKEGQYLDKFPAHPDILLAGAHLAAAEDNTQEAQLSALRALAAKQAVADDGNTYCAEDDHYYTSLSLLLLRLGNNTGAAKAIENALDCHPCNMEILTLAAEAYLALGESASALETIYPAWLQQPDEKRQRLYIAALEANREWQEAITQYQELFSKLAAIAGTELHAYARCALNCGATDIARQACQQALEIDPGDGVACGLLGRIAEQEDSWQLAAQLYQQATQAAPLVPEFWLSLAALQASNGDRATAQETLRRASRANHESVDIHLALGEHLLDDNDTTQALEHLQLAAILESHPADHTTMTHSPGLSRRTALPLGMALQNLGRQREARQVFEQALEATFGAGISADFDPAVAKLTPEYASAYAKCLLSLKIIRPTIQLFEHCLLAQPDNLTVLLDYSQTCLLDDDQPSSSRKALQALERIINPTIDPLPSDYVLLRQEASILYAEALVLTGDLAGATAAYKSALGLPLAEQPTWHSRICFGLGNTVLALEQYETAITAYQEAAQIDPGNPAIYRQLSRAYLGANLYEEAYHSAQNALELDPDNLESLIWFSDQAMRIEEIPDNAHLRARPKIIQSLQMASHLAPQRADLLLKLSELQLLSGERQAAVATLCAVATAEAASDELQMAAEYLLHLGEYELALPLLERAVQTWQPASSIQSAPDNAPITRALVELSDALQHMGNTNLALQTLDQALSINSHNATLLLAKATLLSESGEIRPAQECLQSALSLSPKSAELHHRMAGLATQVGNYSQALAHACQAVEYLALPMEDNLRVPARLLAARLAIALTMPELVRSMLQDEAIIPDGSVDTEPARTADTAHLLLLRAGLSLDAGDYPTAVQDFSLAQNLLPEHPHTEALQVRLAIRQHGLIEIRKSQPAGWAEDMLQKIESNFIDDPYTHAERLDSLRALTQAALELGDWQADVPAIHLLVSAAPDEAYAHVQYARCLVLQGEIRKLCSAVEAVNFTPVAYSALDTAQLFLDAVQSAQDCLERVQTGITNDTSEFASRISAHVDKSLRRLHCLRLRGQATFQPEPAAVQAYAEALSTSNPSPEEVSSLIIAYGEIWEEKQALQAIRHYPRHPQVLVPAALALHHTNPRSALRLARSAVRIPAQPGACCWPWLTFARIALARLAYEHGEKTDDYDLAIQALQDALNDLPDEPRWHALAAEIYMDTRLLSGHKNPQAAIPHLKAAMRLDPGSAAYPLALGHAHMTLSDFSAAISAYQVSCHLNPDDSAAWLALSTAQQAAGEMNSAIYSAGLAVEHDGNSPAALEQRGRLALAADDPATAMQCADAILQRQPEYPPGWHLLSQAYRQLNQPENALQALEQAITQSSQKKSLEMERASLLSQTQGLESAGTAWQELIDRYPADSLVLAGLAYYEVEAGHTQAAIQAARQALLADVGQLDTTKRLQLNCLIGKHLRLSGQPDDAIPYLQAAIHLAPTDISPYLELGRAYQDLRKTSQAMSTYREAMIIAPKSPWPYYYAGITLKECKDYPEAENMLRRAAQLAPKDVNIHRQLGALVALNLIHNRSTLNMVE